MNKIKMALLSLFVLSGLAIAAHIAIEVPQAEITNGLVKVKLYLPDAENGYYRGTRFDWSGVIPDLEYKGHTYHGKWFDTYKPTNHDAIMGPVEEFDPIGYTEAKVGESFVKIGVGALLKPEESKYNSFKLYSISNPGKWTIKTQPDQVQFTHVLHDREYAYEYQKTVKLIKGKPGMVLMHTLTNTGKRTIETTVFDHNFFILDKQPTGPGYIVSFPFKNLSAKGGKGVGEVIEIKGNQLSYLRELAKREQGYFPDLTGGISVPYEIKVENSKTGAGVKITGNRPITKMVFWSSSTTVSPEPYITIKVAPGKKFSWNINYEYYTNLNHMN